MYKCGCTFPWAGADEMCNVHQAGVPHCPWCEARHPVLMAAPFLVIFAGQGLAIYYFNRKRRFSIPKLMIVGLSVFLMLGVVNGWIFKLMDGYPHFFFD